MGLIYYADCFQACTTINSIFNIRVLQNVVVKERFIFSLDKYMLRLYT